MLSRLEINRLKKFLTRASVHCYLGKMKRSDTLERPGFYEMDYSDGEWSYRDSFTGYYVSSGQEIVRLSGRPVWSLSYGGGVKEEHYGDQKLFEELEQFLKLALSQSEEVDFQPRGLKQFEKADWRYRCDWIGDIKNFNGVEKILFKEEEVFEHRFFGGLIVGR